MPFLGSRWLQFLKLAGHAFLFTWVPLLWQIISGRHCYTIQSSLLMCPIPQIFPLLLLQACLSLNPQSFPFQVPDQLANLSAICHEGVYSYFRPLLFPYHVYNQEYSPKFCFWGEFPSLLFLKPPSKQSYRAAGVYFCFEPIFHENASVNLALAFLSSFSWIWESLKQP